MNNRDYAQLAVEIFRDEEAGIAWEADESISAARRKFIDRFFPTGMPRALRRAALKTVEARKQVDVARKNGGKLPAATHPTPPQQIANVWTLDPKNIAEMDDADRSLHVLLDRYERVAFAQGRLEGQFWQLVGQAHDQHITKVGKKKISAGRVRRLRKIIYLELEDLFARRPLAKKQTDNALAKKISGEVDGKLNLLPGKKAPSVGTIRRYVKEYRQLPENTNFQFIKLKSSA